MDLDVHERRPDGTADPAPKHAMNIVRIETTVEADDGQQYRIMLLDADDSFDIIVTFPDNENEIVWSLVRERMGQ